MSQLTIYLDAKSEPLIEKASRREALSLSRWAREKLLLAAGAPSWPKGYEKLLGSIRDPSFRAPRELPEGADKAPEFS